MELGLQNQVIHLPQLSIEQRKPNVLPGASFNDGELRLRQLHAQA
jgi:hypothetical protein